MRVKEGWILFWLFIGLLVAPIIVIVCEVSLPSDYSHIKKYQMSNYASPLRFHVIGDFGDLDTTTPINNTEPVIVVADVMQRNSLIRPISMIVSVGDNLYPEAYSEFQQTLFELMFKTFNIKGLQGKPWYLVLGNHDVEITSDYEIDADSLYPMWNMPDHNFTLNVALNDEYQVGFTFIDANIFIGNDEDSANSQYAWLRQVLSAQQSDPAVLWKVVTFHQPMWSPGSGHGDDEKLKKNLYPILYEYQVDLVLNGHEHIMAHMVSVNTNGQQPYQALPNIEYECNNDTFMPYGDSSDWTQGDAMHEVIQGAGGRELYELCPNQTTSMADLLFGNINFGFCEVFIDSALMQIDYYNVDQIQPLFTVRIYSKLD